MRILLCAAVLLLALLLTSIHADSTILTPAADTWLNALSPATAYAGLTYLWIGPNKNGLIRFTLSGQLPQGQYAAHAELKVWITYASSNTGIHIYQETDAWNESSATWNTRDGSTVWGGSSGGFGSGMVSGSDILNTSTVSSGYTGWFSFDVTEAVQNWYDGSDDNCGLLLQRSGGGEIKFGSRESSWQPQLIVTMRTTPPIELWQESVDSSGIHYRWGRDEVPRTIRNFINPQADIPMAATAYRIPQDTAPTGLYAGEMGSETWDYVLTKLVERYGSSYYVNGGVDSATRQGQMDLARCAARLGVRIYYQNQASELYWPNRITIGGDRAAVYEQIETWAAAMLPQFTTDPELKQGLLIWGFCEEIDLETAQEPLLAQCRSEVMKAQDPYHPAQILLMGNTYSIQQELFKQWGTDIPIMATDLYFSHTTVMRASQNSFFISRLAAWQNLALTYHAKLWTVSACFSQNNSEPSTEAGGWKMCTPEDINLSMWTGLAYGVTGFYLFLEYSDAGYGRAALTRFDWQPTEEYAAAQRFFKMIRRLEPIIAYWSPAQATIYSNYLAVGSMQHPDFNGTFKVIANAHQSAALTYTIPDDGVYYELETYSPVSGAFTLEPAKGRILFKGAYAEVRELKNLIGPSLGIFDQNFLSAIQAQLWTTAAADEETVASRNTINSTPISLGGKGGKPWYYSDEEITSLPYWAGELLEWSSGIVIPAGVYYPPRPGAGETMLFLQWDLSDYGAASRGVEVESALISLPLSSALIAGRVGVYPVVGREDNLLYNVMEFMPRWEKDQFTLAAGGTLPLEIGGIVQEWIDGSLPNLGVLVVYCGWPGTTNAIEVEAIPQLKLTYRRHPMACAEVQQLGKGLDGDINRDCEVNLADLAMMSAVWLESNVPAPANMQ